MQELFFGKEKVLIERGVLVSGVSLERGSTVPLVHPYRLGS